LEWRRKARSSIPLTPARYGRQSLQRRLTARRSNMEGTRCSKLPHVKARQFNQLLGKKEAA
jgi:hypothetical protein